jgi:hypothetical protein
MTPFNFKVLAESLLFSGVFFAAMVYLEKILIDSLM